MTQILRMFGVHCWFQPGVHESSGLTGSGVDFGRSGAPADLAVEEPSVEACGFLDLIGLDRRLEQRNPRLALRKEVDHLVDDMRISQDAVMPEPGRLQQTR